jgi:hypothetical protein
MPNTLFVCYRHGCRGENMAHRISQHPLFRTLEADKVNGRTIIRNDYFDKKFVAQRDMVRLDQLQLPAEDIVVPSHYFYDDLYRHFPNAKYLSIDIPHELEDFNQKLFDRYHEYKASSLLELVGECENAYRDYNSDATEQDVKNFTVEMLKRGNPNFGDIKCFAAGLEPTTENKFVLLNREAPKPLTKLTKTNSMVVPYEQVQSIPVDEIVNYFSA